MSEVVVTKRDNGKTITISLQDTLVLYLAENPTTGFVWQVEKMNKHVLHCKASDAVLMKKSGLGGGSFRQFRCSPQKVGKVELQLKHWREWEGDSSIRDRFRLLIKINR